MSDLNDESDMLLRERIRFNYTSRPSNLTTRSSHIRESFRQYLAPLMVLRNVVGSRHGFTFSTETVMVSQYLLLEP